MQERKPDGNQAFQRKWNKPEKYSDEESVIENDAFVGVFLLEDQSWHAEHNVGEEEVDEQLDRFLRVKIKLSQ